MSDLKLSMIHQIMAFYTDKVENGKDGEHT